MDDEIIPKHFILLEQNNLKNIKFGWLNDELLKILVPEQKNSKDVVKINKNYLDARSFIHGIGSKKITFSNTYFKERRLYTELNDDVGCSILKYYFEDIFLGIYYTNDKYITSVKLEYSFFWGPIKDDDESKILKSVKLLDDDLEFMFKQKISEMYGPYNSSKSYQLVYELKFKKPLKLEKMMKYVWHFNSFLMLIKGEIIFPDTINAETSDGEKFVYLPKLLRYLKQKHVVRKTFSRIGYHEIEKHFDIILNSWFNLYKTIGEPISEYFQTFYTPLGYRSRLLENINSFQRIYKQTDPEIKYLMGSIEDAAKLYHGLRNIDPEYLCNIKETRNHYAHGDLGKLKSGVATELGDIGGMAYFVGMLVESKLISKITVENANVLRNSLLLSVFDSFNYKKISYET